MKLPQLREKVDRLIIHCSATEALLDIGALELDLWHRKRGLFQIGYHAVIRRSGAYEPGRDITAMGAHAMGYNQRSLGVCLIGGVGSLPDSAPVANYSESQIKTLNAVLDGWLHIYPAAEIVGHCELRGSPHARLKLCPSFSVAGWVDAGRPLDVKPFSYN